MDKSSGLKITPNLIEEYVASRTQDGLKSNTISTYRAKLHQMYDALPEDKTIYRGTILSIADRMREDNYSMQAINVVLAIADSFVTWCGCPELQAVVRMKVEDSIQPEITRSEYLRLLSAAKRLDRERDYLIVKTIALTGANLTELLSLAREDVERGWLMSGAGESRRIPQALQEELLDYIERNDLSTGAIFRNLRDGSPISRIAVTHAVNSLARSAMVDDVKCNPRCLRKLYQETQAGYREMMQALVDQAQERQLEKEQRISGWSTH